MMIKLAVLLPFFAAALIPLVHKFIKREQIGWFVLAVPIILFALISSYIPHTANGKTFIHTLEWIPSLSINFTTYLDGLSMIFGLLITGVGSLVILYSNFYLSAKESLHHFYCYLLLFMGAMLGVVFSDNLLVLYTFWELTSVSSFLLIAFWHHRKASRAGARKAMVITVSGGVAMLVGFLMLYAMTNTFSIRELVAQVDVIQQHELFIPALLCVLLGAFTKSAQFPFHIWLPDAMEAPTPVSAYLHSATMVKAGIYLVARMTPIFGGAETWFWLVTSVGLLTLIWGSFNAVRQNDLKALLAYSTVSQLGLIMSLFGIGSLALAFDFSEELTPVFALAGFTALFHLMNHSTFKGALFMMVGIVDHEVGTRDLRRLGGLLPFMPLTFSIALIGAFAMAGLPPFNGFLSKEMFFTAVTSLQHFDVFSLESAVVWMPIVAWLASVFTFVYSMIIIFKTFFGKYHRERLDKEPHEAPFGMLVSPFILCALVVLIFFFPNVLAHYVLQPALASVYPTLPLDAITPHISPWHGFNLELFMTLGVIVLGIVLYKTKRYWSYVYTFLQPRHSFNALYEWIVTTTENTSQRVTNKYMNGYLVHYFTYIYIIFLAVIGGYFVMSGAFNFDPSTDSKVETYELMLVCIVACAAVSLLFAKSRLSSVLITGLIGYSVGFFFIIFRAPDLALTQLVVESVTTALFLVSFKYLPNIKPEPSAASTKWRNAIISVAVGSLVTIIGLTIVNYDQFEPISKYFENSYELAGGKNIVNAILGDFRAFDTMLEVVVLFIAGLGVYALIKLRGRKEAADIENK